MLFLCEKRFQEANPLLQQISPEIENWVVNYQVKLVNNTYHNNLTCYFIGNSWTSNCWTAERVFTSLLFGVASLLLFDGGSGQIREASIETITTIYTGER